MKEKPPITPELPIHPWIDRLTKLPEGKGNFYHFGPNYTVDPIVLTSDAIPSILLIERKDTHTWALPGGFVDGDEQLVEAGLRELQEETHLELTETEPVVLYQGPVNDHRTTRNAWPETTALLWRVDSVQKVAAGDDAAKAVWIPIDQLPENLHGSHAHLIELALQYIAVNESACEVSNQPE